MCLEFINEKEQAAARAFGFPQFHRVMDAELELSAEEKNTFDGFWILGVDRFRRNQV